MNRAVVALISVAGLACAAAGQTIPTVIFSNIAGDPSADVPGRPGVTFQTGIGTQFDRPFGAPRGGAWAFKAETAPGAATADTVIVRGAGPTRAGAAVIAFEGETPAGFAAPWGPFDQKLALMLDGTVVLANNLGGASTIDDEVIATLDPIDPITVTYLFREGNAGPLPDTTFGTDLNSPCITDAGVVGCQAQLAGAGVTTATNYVLLNGGTVLAQKGVTTPAGASFTWGFFDAGDFNMSEDGARYSQKGDDNDPNTAIDDIADVNGTVVLREGSVPPGLTTAIALNGIDELFMSARGDWMSTGNNVNADEDWVYYNGTPVAVGLNDITPANPSGELFDDATFADLFFSVAQNGCGDFVIGGVTNNPDPLRDAVYVLNRSTVIARQSDPVDLDGDGLADSWYMHTFNNHDAFLTDDGLLYFFADLKTDPLATAATNQAMLVVRVFCAADYNRDGVVDFNDLLEFLNQYNASSRCADVNGDGVVDFNDFLEFLNRYNAPCP